MQHQKKQDVGHIKIIGNSVSIVILKEKKHKLDIHQNWKSIQIGYSQDTSKYV